MKNFYKKNTIVLIKFPFSDSSNVKVRPALIICDQFDEDITCLPISSSYKKSSHDLKLAESDVLNFSFPIQSFVRIRKISTLQQSLVVKKLGSLKKETFLKIKEKLKIFLNLES